MNPKDRHNNNNNKKWGNKFIDKKNWKSYNEELVRRGEILFDFSTINNWKQELKQLNKGKVGEPYHYPNSSCY